MMMGPLMRITRNMVIVRDEGRLSLINAVRLNAAEEQALEDLGTVTNVVRIGVHGMDDAYYVDKYKATLWALPGVEHKNGIKTGAELTDERLPFPARLFSFEHTRAPEGALLWERDGGVLLTCDSVQNWENTEGCSPPAALLTRVMGFLKPAQIGPPWRKIMTPKGGSLLPDFQRLVELPFKHLIGGHGAPLRDEAQQKLQETIKRVYG